MITLDVQGQIFKTDITTINKLSYFKNMFEDCGGPSIEGNPSDIVFVNRPAHIFKHVISLITDDTYPYPEKYKFELDFYGYDITNVNFYNENKEVLKRVEELENKCKKLKLCAEDECDNVILHNDIYCKECENKNFECKRCYRYRLPGSKYCAKCDY
jgi:hypothetical protein